MYWTADVLQADMMDRVLGESRSKKENSVELNLWYDVFHRRTWLYRDMYPEAPEYGIYIFQEDAVVGESAIKALGLDDVSC